jgi:DNA-binding LacI/PurR family transcriptional regulator
MNGRSGYTPETGDRVLKAVAALGYAPNTAARHLRTRRARRVGYSLTGDNLDFRNPFAMTFLRSVIAAAAGVEFRVVVLIHPDEHDGAFASDVAASEVDGFILANCTPDDYRVKILSEKRIPFAVMGRTAPNQPQAWADIDNVAAISSAVDYLVSRGHSTFGYVGYSGDEYWTVQRFAGARDRLAEHGLELPSGAVVTGSIDTVHAGIRALLNDTQRPEAIITGSDMMGVIVENIAQAEGIVVGTELALTGFDGGILDHTVVPALTSVRIPVAKIARAVVDRFMHEMDNGPTGEPGRVFDTELVFGGTA